MIDASRLSFFGKAEAMPLSIHARLRFRPSRCASLGSLGSGDATGCNHAAQAGDMYSRNIQIADLNAITAWMCYSNFLNRLDLGRIQDDYSAIL